MTNFTKYAVLFVAITVVMSSCGTRRNVVYTPAARTADAMANLKSKKLYNFITSWAGVKYRLGGTDKKGVDCSAFALLLEKEIYNLDLPRTSIAQSKVIKEKKQGQLAEGDLVFFSFGGNEVDHVGVYLNDNFFVHASTTRGVVVDDLNSPVYQKTLVHSGTIKN